MTQRQVKARLYELICSYFGASVVIWGQASSVRPQSPLITLQAGSVVRPYHSITKTVNGIPVDCYPSTTTVQVDLFTKGARITDETGVTATFENTAVDDLIDFVNFINSGYASDWCARNDISILAHEVHDLTQLINATAWDYRAMVELDVGFTQTAAGYSGTMWEDGVALDEEGNPLPSGTYPFKPTPSGGRTEELAGQSVGYFEKVQIEQKEEARDGQQS